VWCACAAIQTRLRHHGVYQETEILEEERCGSRIKGLIHGLNKQVEETADKQEQSEDNFRGHITELEKVVQRQNIEIKQVKAMLGGRITAIEVKMEQRVSQREELEATPALEEEFKEVLR